MTAVHTEYSSMWRASSKHAGDARRGYNDQSHFALSFLREIDFWPVIVLTISFAQTVEGAGVRLIARTASADRDKLGLWGNTGIQSAPHEVRVC